MKTGDKKKKEPRRIVVATKGDQPPQPPVDPPAPAPIPVPTPKVPTFDIGTPPPGPRGRSRSAEPRVAKPRAKRAASRVPWTAGMFPEEAQIPAPTLPISDKQGPAPPLEPKPVRGRSRGSSSAERGPPRAKAKARSATSADTIAYPEEVTIPSAPGLPSIPEEPKPAKAATRVRKTALKPKKLAADIGAAPAATPAPKARGRPPKAAKGVPEAAPQTGRKPRIRKVKIVSSSEPEAATLPVKRGRGRPKGSLGKKNRDKLVEEELRRLAAVVV